MSKVGILLEKLNDTSGTDIFKSIQGEIKLTRPVKPVVKETIDSFVNDFDRIIQELILDIKSILGARELLLYHDYFSYELSHYIQFRIKKGPSVLLDKLNFEKVKDLFKRLEKNKWVKNTEVKILDKTIRRFRTSQPQPGDNEPHFFSIVFKVFLKENKFSKEEMFAVAKIFHTKYSSETF